MKKKNHKKIIEKKNIYLEFVLLELIRKAFLCVSQGGVTKNIRNSHITTSMIF